MTIDQKEKICKSILDMLCKRHGYDYVNFSPLNAYNQRTIQFCKYGFMSHLYYNGSYISGSYIRINGMSKYPYSRVIDTLLDLNRIYYVKCYHLVFNGNKLQNSTIECVVPHNTTFEQLIIQLDLEI